MSRDQQKHAEGRVAVRSEVARANRHRRLLTAGSSEVAAEERQPVTLRQQIRFHFQTLVALESASSPRMQACTRRASDDPASFALPVHDQNLFVEVRQRAVLAAHPLRMVALLRERFVELFVARENSNDSAHFRTVTWNNGDDQRYLSQTGIGCRHNTPASVPLPWLAVRSGQPGRRSDQQVPRQQNLSEPLPPLEAETPSSTPQACGEPWEMLPRDLRDQRYL